MFDKDYQKLGECFRKCKQRTSCPTIQANSTLTLSSQRYVRSRRLTLKSTGLPSPHFECQRQVVDPQVTHNCFLTWLQIGGPHDLVAF